MPATDKVKNPYGSTVVKNPFGGPNQVFSDIHQNPTGAFGTWSKQDQALFNTSMAEAQWLAELSLMDYQNEYNSPQAQAQRMREAGLNPDLLGVEQGGTSADGTAPGAAAPDGSNPMDVANTILNITSTAFSLTSGLMTGALSVFNGLADYDAKNIANVSALLGLGKDVASMSLPATPEYGSDGLLGSVKSDFNIPLTSRNQRALKRMWNSISGSPMVARNFWSDSKDAVASRQETAKYVSSPFNADDFNEMVNAFRPVTKLLADHLNSELLSDIESLTSSYRYSKQANDINLPESEASSALATSEFSRGETNMMNDLKAPLRQLIKNLDAKAKEGKSWANMALISLYAALSATVSRSSSQSVNGSTGEVFENSSWNFGF